MKGVIAKDMKTPDEIKKGLECCDHEGCLGCPYDDTCEVHYVTCAKDALAYIRQLERERDATRQERDGLSIMLTSAESAFETMKRERDALLADLREADRVDCSLCKSYIHAESNDCEYADFLCDNCEVKECSCRNCKDGSNWQWRGVPEVE